MRQRATRLSQVAARPGKCDERRRLVASIADLTSDLEAPRLRRDGTFTPSELVVRIAQACERKTFITALPKCLRQCQTLLAPSSRR